MYPNFLIQTFVSGHLDSFHVLAIVNSAAMNNGIYVSLSIMVSPGYMPRSGIAGSYGGFIPSFFFFSQYYIYFFMGSASETTFYTIICIFFIN